jgi:hypothetical protein
VSSKLQDGTLAIGTGGDDTDIGWVVNRNDDASGEDDFLPGKLVSKHVEEQIDG